MHETETAGTLYWITGLSGSGKTTVGSHLLALLRQRRPATIFLDGDELRDVFAITEAYSPEDRLQLASRYARLCRLLTDQGLDVVCCTISLFRQIHQWNRANIPNYREIYLRVPIEVLVARDAKGLYGKAGRGEVAHLVGAGIPFDEPIAPDLVLENDGRIPPEEQARIIVEKFVS